MPTTTNSKLPYPAATDPADVPTDLQKLAAALDQIAYTEFTAAVAISATSGPTANTVVTAASVTFDGVTPVIIEFWVPRVTLVGASTFLLVTLWDGSTDLGFFGVAQNPATGTYELSLDLRRRLTPSAAAHVYSVRGWSNGSGVTLTAGVGGAGVALPGFIRISRA